MYLQSKQPLASWADQIFLTSWRPFVWLASVGFLLYCQSFFFHFVYLDDTVLILDNISFLQNLSNVLKAFSQDLFNLPYTSDMYYRPLVTISWMIDAQISGTSAFVYHATNVIIHIFNACLLFSLLQKLRYSLRASFIASILFITHPLLVQAVVWIPGRNDTLLACFLLLSFLSFVTFLRKRSWRWFCVHIVTFSASLLTKESGIVFIIVCCAYLFCYRRQQNFSATFLKQILSLVLPMWGLSIAVWAIMRQSVVTDSLPLIPSLLQIKDLLKVTFSFIGKFFFPLQLSVIESVEDVRITVGIIATAIFGCLLLLSKKINLSRMMFGLIWSFVFLLPTLPVIRYYVLESRYYIPAIGIILLLLELHKASWALPFRKWALFIFVSILALFVVSTSYYSGFYKDGPTFWSRAVHDAPHLPLSYLNFGVMHYFSGQYHEAEEAFQQTLVLNSNEQFVHNNLGLIYLQQKRLDEAKIAFLQEIQLYPKYHIAYFNLGCVFYQQGDYQEAEELWLKTLTLNPHYEPAQQALESIPSSELER